MLFNSLHFALFFPIVVIVLFAIPHRFRWCFLLAASAYFYMAFIPAYILILLFTILIDYVSGIALERTQQRARKLVLAISIVSNCLVLGVFKYYHFLDSNIALFASLFHLTYQPTQLNIILPIGLSFHTFQSMSYTIEVYLGRQKAERHLGIFALYVLFFPQLVAGPIERPQHLLHQFREEKTFDQTRAVVGLRLMLQGLLKKVVVADRLAILVDRAYAHPEHSNGLFLLVATYLFAIQIYCDFSGYSDIAIGAAKVMGFDLMRNFDSPYSSRSVEEFWRRWHISLSTWFRDYLYIPLGGNRDGLLKQCRNVFIVFCISGLWHGANWTFVVWGLIHGSLVCATLVSKRYRRDREFRVSRYARIADWLRAAVTFHLVVFAWVFFRARDIRDAVTVFRRIAMSAGHLWVGEIVTIQRLHVGLGISVAIAILYMLIDGASAKMPLHERVATWPRALRWTAYYCSSLALLLFGEFNNHQFIYFQF